MSSPFILLYQRGFGENPVPRRPKLAGKSYITVSCYSSELLYSPAYLKLTNNGTYDLNGSNSESLPSWFAFTHGRYGGVKISKTVDIL